MQTRQFQHFDVALAQGVRQGANHLSSVDASQQRVVDLQRLEEDLVCGVAIGQLLKNWERLFTYPSRGCLGGKTKILTRFRVSYEFVATG